jgi:hypothetical protein
MGEEIKKVSEAIREHCDKLGRYDETLVSLGVQLGRLLERNKIDEYRPQVFTDFEQRNIEYERRWGPVKALTKSLFTIIRHAVAEEIHANGSFCFTEDTGFNMHTTTLSDATVKKFHLQIFKSTYQRHNNEMDVRIMLHGELAALLSSYALPTTVRCIALDADEDREEKVMWKPADVHDLYEFTSLLNPEQTDLTEEQIQQLRTNLEKIEFLCRLQSQVDI